MTKSNDWDSEGLRRLQRFLIEDILAASDEEIIAEAIEDGLDPAAIAAEARALVQRLATEEKPGTAPSEAVRSTESDLQAKGIYQPPTEQSREQTRPDDQNIIKFERKRSFHPVHSTPTRIAAASDYASDNKETFLSFIEFDAMGNRFRALADNDGNVVIEGPLQAGWSRIHLGQATFTLKYDPNVPNRAHCIGLGQVDLEAFSFESGSDTVIFS